MKLIDFMSKYNLTKDQKKLVSHLSLFFDNQETQCFLVKGYAGTGKTFITKGITEYFREIGRHYILAAPTGKAAKVIQEKTGSDAYTIHKTIYSDVDLKEYKASEKDRTYKFYFDLRVNEDSDTTVYIIDEASMVSNVYSEMEFIRFGSGYLLNDLFKYINLDQNDHDKKIIFIGDNAQLPPVGMNFSPALNSVYLRDNFQVAVEEYELAKVVRQKETSGILKNSLVLRDAMERKVFNRLEIDTGYDDVTEIGHQDFIERYLEVSHGKIDKDTMVIAYTNASVQEYNQRIRQRIFQDTSRLNVGDKLMILVNNANYEVFLSNGDFALMKTILSEREHKVVKMERKNQETGKVETIKVDLYFRDVELIVKDIRNIPHLIRCKIIENLLFSPRPSLDSDENKAIYLDFVIRMNHEGIKPNTKEFREAIKSDPYFNALKVKFGYAITCHKAQGSEWKNIFLNCHSHQSYLSEGYFRWLYTALTRTSGNLYLLNPPHVGLWDGLNVAMLSTEEEDGLSSVPESGSPTQNEENDFDLRDGFFLAIYRHVRQSVESNGIDIVDIIHHPYQEQYTFKKGDEYARLTIIYNGKSVITSFLTSETNDLAVAVRSLLEPMKGHVIVVPKHDVEAGFEFPEAHLEEYYRAFKERLELIGIEIVGIGHMQYMERYTFKRGAEIAIVDFHYNKKGQITSSKVDKRSNSISLAKEILGSLK